jgi:hypothetical protein
MGMKEKFTGLYLRLKVGGAIMLHGQKKLRLRLYVHVYADHRLRSHINSR